LKSNAETLYHESGRKRNKWEQVIKKKKDDLMTQVIQKDVPDGNVQLRGRRFTR